MAKPRGAGDERFAELLNAVEDQAVLMLDVQGRVQSWNAGAVRLEGYCADEIIGQHISNLFTPEDAAEGKPQQQLELALQHGRFAAEGWRLTKDGSRFWAHTAFTPMYADGCLMGFAAVIRDAGERQLREDALHQAEERFRLLVETVADYAIFMLDPTGKVVTWNRGAQRLKGYSANQIIGRHFSAFYSDEDKASGKPEQELAIARSEGSVEDEGWRIRQDGTRFWANVTITALRDPDGSLVGFAKVTRDMTERRAAEQRLLESNRALQKADAAKNEFLSRVSHELRTPLNAILGFAQMLEIDDPRPGQQDDISQIIRAGRHLLALINEVLDLSRIESGELRLSVEPVSLTETIGETLDLLRPMAAERRIDLLDAPDFGTDDSVSADQQRLVQVLLNLISNAIKYNNEGGSIRLTQERRPGDRIRLSVSDTGPGIPAEKIHLLFAPFERLGAENTQTEGSGLGLALTRRLVESMGGAMGVDSVVGQGSTFWFELAAAYPAGRPPAAKPARQQKACTVLYIEDNRSNVKLIERIVAQEPDLTLLVATAGSAGIELARQSQPDLILLDMNLPDLPGEVVLRRLKSDASMRAVPVVILSADASPTQVKRLKEAGAAEYLTKPIDVARILAVIEERTQPPVRAADQEPTPPS